MLVWIILRELSILPKNYCKYNFLFSRNFAKEREGKTFPMEIVRCPSGYTDP